MLGRVRDRSVGGGRLESPEVCSSYHPESFSGSQSQLSCAGCLNLFEADQERVSASGKLFHKQCLKCSECSAEFVAGNEFYLIQGKVLCAVHSAAKLKICHVCKKLIQDSSAVLTGNRHFHGDCFSCQNPKCRKPLKHEKKVVFLKSKNGEFPYCKEHSASGDCDASCGVCKKNVGFEDKSLVRSPLTGLLYHNSCLHCSFCKIQFSKEFKPKYMNGLFFCQADFDLLTPKCGACGRDILAKSVATKCGQMFHDTCFKCSICRIQLQKFKTHCGELRCEEHMKENPIRDLVCYMCELPIRSSQVQNFSGVLVHKSCFTCGTCRNSIKIKNGQIKAILGKDEVFHCWGCLRKAVGSNIDLKDIIDRRSQVVVEDEEGSAPPKSSEKLLPRFRKFKRWLSSDKAKFNSQRSIESLRPAPEVFDLDVENSDEELEEFKNDEKELTDFLQRNDQEIVTYDKGEKIGEGSFGKVFVCRRRPDNLLMAMKQISLQDVEFLDWNGIMEPNRNPKIREMLKEAQILCKLRHPNVVKFIGAQIDKNRKSLNIFMEYVAGRSMYGHLYEFGAYSEQSVKKPVRQILSGLKYLHSKGIIHRDLKSKNILVSNRGVPKLADFGSAKIIDRTQESQVNSMLEASVHVCTPLYFPPEFVLNNVYTEKSDIWSFGCVVIEMVSAKLPWSEMKFENEWAAARYIAQENAVPQVNVSLSDCCRDFILSSLNRDPKKRPTAEELLNHPFLK